MSTLKSFPEKCPDSPVLSIASPELLLLMVSFLYGEEIQLMLLDISLLKLLTLHSKIPSKYTYVPSTLKLKNSSSSLVTQLLEVLLELHLYVSFIPLISLELDLLLIWVKLDLDNSMDQLIVCLKSSNLMDFPVYIKVSVFLFLELSLIEPYISEDMIQENL